jgi:AraC-like DNA-binding protein
MVAAPGANGERGSSALRDATAPRPDLGSPGRAGVVGLIDESFRTTSTSEAEELIGRVYQRPSIKDTSDPFVFRQRTRGDQRVNITRFQISSPAVTAVDLETVIGVGHLRSGQYEVQSNGVRVDASRPFLLRPGQASSWSNDLDIVMVNFDLGALSRFAATHGLAAEGRLRFDLTTASPEVASTWNRVLAHVTELFADPDLFNNELIRIGAVDLLYSAALATFLTDRATSPSPAPAYPGSVRRALQFIDDNAASPIDVADIAAAARLSVRGLQAAFRRELDTTPAARLRTVRLAHAHSDLLAADPRTDSVAAIARRWGFAHLGRFAAIYRDTYHQLPRQTLEG